MKLSCKGSTDQSLLSEVANWENQAAWARFRATYDPSLRRWCRRYGLNNDSIEEVCQLIWIELAHRMRTFEYDPSRTFRGWLRRLCESRVLNFLRQRRATPLVSLDERDFNVSPGTTGVSADDESAEGNLHHHFLLEEAAKVQAGVRAKVKPHTWDAYWLVAVYDWSVERTAQSLGMSRTAVYAARERVAEMLFDAGKRVSDGRLDSA
jgi:RNA polymerase sigma factor (sigma-70 family)